MVSFVSGWSAARSGSPVTGKFTGVATRVSTCNATTAPTSTGCTTSFGRRVTAVTVFDAVRGVTILAGMAGMAGGSTIGITPRCIRSLAVVGGTRALGLVAGACSGRESARSRVAAESAQLAAAYVQGLDARSMTAR